MELDMGMLYRKIMKSDPERKVYGLIPLMASCSYASLGALNAESFCERVLSAANLVVTDGNTLLAPEEVEMLSVLRMNRGYMENSRSKYAEEAKQQFKMTVVEEHEQEHEQEAEAAPPSSAAVQDV